MRRNRWCGWMVGVLCLLCAACADEADPMSGKQQVTTYKVAVFYSAQQQTRLQRTAAWAQEILSKAQESLERAVRLELEWHDEAAADWRQVVERVSTDPHYVALIGPNTPEKAAVAATACQDTRKTLLLPTTANAEFQREYASNDYVFCLTQNDIMQAEVLFSLFKYSLLVTPDADNQVALITSEDAYGDTFRQWFGYLAAEKYYKTAFVKLLNDRCSVEEAIQEAYHLVMEEQQKIPYLFFAPSDDQDFIRADAEISRLQQEMLLPIAFWFRLFCADACVTERVSLQVKNSYEGVDLAPNPESGFTASYTAKFGEEPMGGEAQLFDALYLLTYALTAREAQQPVPGEPQGEANPSDLSDYMIKVVDGRDSNPYSWLEDDAYLALEELQAGHYPDLTGVSSDLTFDAKYHAAVTTSTYRHWRLHNGKFVTLEYLTADGSDHTVSSIENWTLQAEAVQQLKEEEVKITYPKQTGNYAMIVAASSGWENYRHQADALAMYQLLKQQGYDDDHILLIMEDDIAQNRYNSAPGVVRVTPDGENLYHDVRIDYKMSDLTPADLQAILTGEPTAHTPQVLPTGAGDNLFLFWSGHGDYGSLHYGKEYVTTSALREILTRMAEKRNYRKLFFAIEACYAGSVVESCEGLEGMLFLTAANNAETSKADMKDEQLHVYLSNGFTRAFQTKLTEQPDVSLRDLFYFVATQTVGSHASLYNQSHYGNVFTERMGEYMRFGR